MLEILETQEFELKQPEFAVANINSSLECLAILEMQRFLKFSIKKSLKISNFIFQLKILYKKNLLSLKI